MSGFAKSVLAGAGAALLALASSGCSAVQTGAASTAAPLAVDQKSVKVAMPQGTADALLFSPHARGKFPAILLWTDITGLRPAFAQVGRNLAARGYVVLVPNMFYRSAAISGALPQPTLTQAEVRERSSKWTGEITDQAAETDARAYFAYLDRLPIVDTARKAGTLGYDFGSPYAFHAAMALPERIGAVAVLHPFRIATERPNSPHLFVNRSKSAYFVALAKPDDEREPGDKDDLRRAFAAAGLPGTVTVYPAGHGFAVPDQGAYDPVVAQQAWEAVVAFFNANLR